MAAAWTILLVCVIPAFSRPNGKTLRKEKRSKRAIQLGYDCDFENGFCTWTQVTNGIDKFDCDRLQGDTPSVLTGPSTDHTLGTTAGWYIYIETSSPRQFNDTAQLISDTIVSTNIKCLRFWYHMYGVNIQTLNVYKKIGTTMDKPVWTKTGDQGDKWYQAEVDVQGVSSYQVVLEGVRGTGFQGDIAVDDITITDGSCQAGPCTLTICQNSGTCQVVNGKAVCSCTGDWTGVNGDVSPCTSMTCMNSGTCQVVNEKAVCSCTVCWTGVNCDTQVARNPCVSVCDKNTVGFYQSCNSCHEYVTCVWGLKYDRVCPGTTMWNDITKICDWTSPTCS